MSLPEPVPAVTAGPEDPDRLVTGYRAAWAQETLFDGPAGRAGGAGYDEFVDAAGNVRPDWSQFAEVIGERGRAGLDRLRATVRALVDNDGITYIAVDDQGEETRAHAHGAAMPTPWQLDGLPLLVSPEDWDTLESGVIQRSRILDAVLADLYGPRRAISGGLLPPELLFAHPGYLRAASGITIPGRHQLFLYGCDVSRDRSGGFVVNADWTQAPSGAGYALAGRRVVAHAAPDLYERVRPRPISPFAQTLRLALINVAPETAHDPVVVVLSPGIHSETAFDQAYLASVLGFPLVESADLVVRGGTLWMRSLGTLKQVDVVLRRVDAEYADPLDLRSDSQLGVVGLVEALRRGTVTVVNTLGSGILESPGLLRFLPELARRLLGETPLLATAPLYWGGIGAERSHLLARLSSLLIKPTTGGPTILGPALSSAQRDALAARIEAAPWRWVGQEPPQFSSAPTGHYPGGLAAGAVGMRLFTVSQRGGYAPMIGGLGYVLAPGDSAHKRNTVAAKDIWVRAPTRAQVEVTVPAAELPAPKPSGTRDVSSPRVLSDLFWLGRYAERAEGMARLLNVTRERYHEYRDRPQLAGSDCVPVLLRALEGITARGTDLSDAELVAGAPRILWSLTVDARRDGSLAQSVKRLGSAAQAVRDQMSKDTWLVLGGVERALAQLARDPAPPAEPGADDTAVAAVHRLTLAGMLALSGVAAESMVRDVDWTMTDIGKRIERGQWVTALLRATLGKARSPAAERAITESTVAACESSVSYLRRNLGAVSVAAVAELVLFEPENPRSLVYQLERLSADLKALPGASGSSKAERLVEEITTRLRRVGPADLDTVTVQGERAVLMGLLDDVHNGLRELSGVISASQLSVPGEMRPLWGSARRSVP
ncbi:circularly permuted type 2 ATP-grasp protein [Mycobacterium sp. SM1]|uniref:circularly permuted type 2 ATP-grasp protein n=1 Tax=Mycobacterium sp. SM1 TaxID=2816243 RepID=UPI001BCC3D2C|nr:circularly permuted type 2 ATP-grasp protein [Mycobacterium sp. SM1]MBS4729392.1 circularly permuted type 2 ATP-grasp protein [Mycobacterium sp. SM1]